MNTLAIIMIKVVRIVMKMNKYEDNIMIYNMDDASSADRHLFMRGIVNFSNEDNDYKKNMI